MSDFRIYAAPLQGYTEAPWRAAHSRIAGGVDTYFTPFLRIEKGDVRRRDMRDIASPVNTAVPVAPQILFGSTDEFLRLTAAVAAAGYTRIDINMGCPFPPQVHHGRGAGMIARTDLLGEIAGMIKAQTDIQYSVKMRLGAKSPDEWRAAMHILNDLPLTHIVLHPRIATQQYRGELDYAEFEKFAAECRHPLIFNGDLLTVGDIDAVRRRFPSIAGVMLGRGLLVRPMLAARYTSGRDLDDDADRDALLAIHDAIYTATAPTLCGDAQILAKIKPYWDYAGTLFNRKAVKAIAKASSTSAYLAAVHVLAGC